METEAADAYARILLERVTQVPHRERAILLRTLTVMNSYDKVVSRMDDTQYASFLQTIQKIWDENRDAELASAILAVMHHRSLYDENRDRNFEVRTHYSSLREGINSFLSVQEYPSRRWPGY